MMSEAQKNLMDHLQLLNCFVLDNLHHLSVSDCRYLVCEIFTFKKRIEQIKEMSYDKSK